MSWLSSRSAYLEHPPRRNHAIQLMSGRIEEARARGPLIGWRCSSCHSISCVHTSFFRRGMSVRSRGSRRKSPPQTSTPMIAGIKKGSPTRRCVTVAPPR